MIKIIDKFKLIVFTLEQMFEDIKNKPSVEIKQESIEENFLKIYDSMQKYVQTPEQRKKANQILKKYNQMQINKDDAEYPKGLVYKEPLCLNGLFENMGKPIKINYT
ncbi:MAG: hypothetical protein KKF74_04730 [Nanoarchaeota archaeon]|nr:hypothetical protein [Nanoarchaeota archaeon]